MNPIEIEQAKQMIVELAQERKVPIGNEDVRNEVALRFNIRRGTMEKAFTGYGDGASYEKRLSGATKTHIIRDSETGEVLKTIHEK